MEQKKQKKKKGISMMMALLLTALIPTVLSAFVIAFVGTVSLESSLEDVVYHELTISADGLRKFYAWDIANMENHMPVYEHDYVDSLLDEGIHLTIFMEDISPSGIS